MFDYISKWHRELAIFCKIKPLILLEGNVLDSYQYPVEGSTPKNSILRLTEYLHYFFKDTGYQNIIFYDSIQGFYNNYEKGYLENFAKLSGTSSENGYIRADFRSTRDNSVAALTRRILSQNKEASVIVMDFVSRYIISPDNMTQAEVDSFTSLIQASLEAKNVRTNEHGTLKNLLILITNKSNDIPVWFYLQNPNVKIVNISAPSKEEREILIKGINFRTFFVNDIYCEDMEYYNEHNDELKKIQDRFVALTDGFSFTELNGLRMLCKNEKIRIKNLCDVVDLYKYGVKENPWKALHTKLKDAKAHFELRVKGQDYAVEKTLDVIKRAIIGLSGLQGSSHTRPKGVLFFAGPTGTGKTETAKTLAEILFGDESCCIRFDMSEYGQSHSDQKLLGAPPGYVGYEAGGQLTNAVTKNPFCILLFDEIEKAHPSVLDKFLQILEDGRMTDGQGNTVYFSESIIIFTSNLGIYTLDEYGNRHSNVTNDMSYEEVREKVRNAVEDYFKLQLGRPEILNRIGENIVVFDFIHPDIARMILKAQIDKIIKNLAIEKHITLSLADSVINTLVEASNNNLVNGGRGIGNVVEDLLINPLSRYLFDNEIFENATVTIQEINTSGNLPELICERSFI